MKINLGVFAQPSSKMLNHAQWRHYTNAKDKVGEELLEILRKRKGTVVE